MFTLCLLLLVPTYETIKNPINTINVIVCVYVTTKIQNGGTDYHETCYIVTLSSREKHRVLIIPIISIILDVIMGIKAYF